MRNSLLILLFIFMACNKEAPEKEFDYITFTPFNSAIVKISDLSKYKLELSTEIDGEIKKYDFYKENTSEIFETLLSGEIIFYINVEAEKDRISLIFSMRENGNTAQGHSVMYIPVKGKLKERSQNFTGNLNCMFTLLDDGKKNIFKFNAVKIKAPKN